MSILSKELSHINRGHIWITHQIITIIGIHVRFIQRYAHRSLIVIIISYEPAIYTIAFGSGGGDRTFSIFIVIVVIANISLRPAKQNFLSRCAISLMSSQRETLQVTIFHTHIIIGVSPLCK